MANKLTSLRPVDVGNCPVTAAVIIVLFTTDGAGVCHVTLSALCMLRPDYLLSRTFEETRLNNRL